MSSPCEFMYAAFFAFQGLDAPMLAVICVGLFCCVYEMDERGRSGTEHPRAGLPESCLRLQPMSI